MKRKCGVVFLFTLLFLSLTPGCLNGCGGGSTSSTGGTGGCSSCSTAPAHYVAVTDYYQRVLIFDKPISTGQNGNVVLGWASFTQQYSNSMSLRNEFSGEVGLAFDLSGNLYVADSGDNRVLQFVPPFSNGMNASNVFGQGDYITNTGSSSAKGLSDPEGVASDASGNLWVADTENCRVLEYKLPFASGMAASVAIGQSSTSATQECPYSPSILANCTTTAATLCGPSSLAFDSHGNLWVADTGSNRVLEYAPPFTNGMAASLELGQDAGPDAFTSSSNSPLLNAENLFQPTGVTVDAHGNVWVADNYNFRVIEFVPPLSNGMAATLELGFPSFTWSGSYPLSTSQSSFDQPFGVAFDTNGDLLVADTLSSRVMVFTPPFSSGMDASIVLGKISFTDANCGAGARNLLCGPMGVAAF